MSWLFGGPSTPPSQPPVEEKPLPDLPPGLQTLPPPTPPRGVSVPSGSFSGFSEPPPSPPPVKGGPSSSPSFSYAFTPPTKGTDYNTEDFSKYASPYTESPGIRDAEFMADFASRREKTHSWLDEHVTNPRLRGCIDAVKMGMKMGCAVGGIFGGLTGTYAAITNRNLLILPLSVVGGALSFGFFLGCGMVIRCDEPRGIRPLPSGYSCGGPSMLGALGMRPPLLTYGWDRQKQE